MKEAPPPGTPISPLQAQSTCPSCRGPTPAARPTGRRKQDKAGKEEEGILTLGRSQAVGRGPWTA